MTVEGRFRRLDRGPANGRYRRKAVAEAGFAQGQLSAESSRLPDRSRTARFDPFETFMPPQAAGRVAQEAVIRVRLLVMLADRLTSVRLTAPWPL
jgi:hypothetical protein